MAHCYADIPLEASPYGERLYSAGRRLVAERGVRLASIVWDADEVLWDWVMDARHMVRDLARTLDFFDLSHREYYLVKPGVFELIWGMHHESLERGYDPYMRVWTNGYPWRLWRIASEIPGFCRLLGPPAHIETDDHGGFTSHPRMFYRTDYVRVVRQLIEEEGGTDAIEGCESHVRALIDAQLSRDPFDSSFKLPEFAQLVGKAGFEEARILIDDTSQNVRRFVASGRHGIHVACDTPRLVFGTVPNTVWGEPRRVLEGLANSVATEIASALDEVWGREHPTRATVASKASVDDYRALRFEIDVPDNKLRAEWLDPIRRLKETWRERAAVT
ncbi:MAG: hypothetical protein ACOCV2_08750 [Persicimonas sp.]